MSIPKNLDRALSQSDSATWDFRCPVAVGADEPCGFSSTGWPSKAVAAARGGQHYAEHRGEGLMQELNAFRREQGLAADVPEGGVRVEDL